MPAALKAALHSLLPKPYSMEASTAFQKRASAFSTSEKFISPRSNLAWAASRSAPIFTSRLMPISFPLPLCCRLVLLCLNYRRGAGWGQGVGQKNAPANRGVGALEGNVVIHSPACCCGSRLLWLLWLLLWRRLRLAARLAANQRHVSHPAGDGGTVGAIVGLVFAGAHLAMDRYLLAFGQVLDQAALGTLAPKGAVYPDGLLFVAETRLHGNGEIGDGSAAYVVGLYIATKVAGKR